MTLPPSVLGVLESEGLEELRTVVAAGEACSLELVRRWSGGGRAFFNAYGPTETTVCASMYRCGGDEEEAPPIGRPLRNMRLYVLDGNQRVVAEGLPGELCVSGAGVAQGYLRRPDLTAEKFVPDPYSGEAGGRLYRTGDLVRWRRDGNLEFLGRIDHQVKLRGFRIELGEIEAVLSRHPGIKSNVVHVREDTPGDQRLVAYVVPTPGATPEAEAMRATLRAQLPEYMVPGQFVVLDAFPLTPNGKVDRKALPVPEASAPSEADEVAEALMSPVQRQVAALWRGILKLDRVGLHANFFDIGGHSLLLVRLQAALKREFGQEIPLVELFQRTTVAAQAERLGAPAGTNSALERARARAAKQIQG